MEIIKLVAEHVLPFVSMILIGVAPIVILWLSKTLERKLNIQIGVEQEKLIAEIVVQGIGSAEEWAMHEIKAGRRPTGSEKLAKALEFVRDMLSKYKVQETVRDEIAKRIEAALGVQRMTSIRPAQQTTTVVNATVVDSEK